MEDSYDAYMQWLKGYVEATGAATAPGMGMCSYKTPYSDCVASKDCEHCRMQMYLYIRDNTRSRTLKKILDACAADKCSTFMAGLRIPCCMWECCIECNKNMALELLWLEENPQATEREYLSHAYMRYYEHTDCDSYKAAKMACSAAYTYEGRKED